MKSIDVENRPSPVTVWLLAARPKTLPAGIVPVLVAGVIAYSMDSFHLLSFVAALAGSVLIQIGTNFANDLFDFIKKTDTADRIGPTRVTQAGLVTRRQITAATIIVFTLAFLIGIYLVYRGGWPIVIIGLASIACGILYTATPLALGYIGIADLFVLIFYGPVALAGTVWVLAHEFSWAIVLAGLPFGMISTAILTVNNLRDIDTDRRAGKKSLAVRFGRNFARFEYGFMMFGAVAIAVWLALLTGKLYLLITTLYIFPAIPTMQTVFTKTDGAVLNAMLAHTGRLLLIYGLLFSIGWLL